MLFPQLRRTFILFSHDTPQSFILLLSLTHGLHHHLHELQMCLLADLGDLCPDTATPRSGVWTDMEDAMLLDAYARRDGRGWSWMSSQVPGRKGKQLRERWFNHLDPTLVQGELLPEERVMLHELVRQWGRRWSLIARTISAWRAANGHFGRRGDNQLKNNYISARLDEAPLLEREDFAAFADAIAVNDAIAAVTAEYEPAADPAADPAAERDDEPAADPEPDPEPDPPKGGLFFSTVVACRPCPPRRARFVMGERSDFAAINARLSAPAAPCPPPGLSVRRVRGGF